MGEGLPITQERLRTALLSITDNLMPETCLVVAIGFEPMTSRV
jgi:hypothetical protein